jgi:hypothetical protein
MADHKKIPLGGANAQGAVEIERFDSVAEQDFTPEAAGAVLQLAIDATTASLMQLVGANPAQSLLAAQSAHRAILAAVDALSVIVRRAR